MPLTLAWPVCSPATGGGVGGSVCHSGSAGTARSGISNSKGSSSRRIVRLRDVAACSYPNPRQAQRHCEAGGNPLDHRARACENDGHTMNAPVASPVSALCECGSGLRAIRCCSMQLGSLPPPEAIRHLVPLVERAIQAHRQGADETADRLCLDVLELAPDRPGALSVLYDIRKAQGK